MSQRGFALLAVLWVLTALMVLTAAGLLVARLGFETTRNRILLARSEWARDACGEILLARFAANPSRRRVEDVDLGRGTWCRASVEDPTAKLNLNVVERDALAHLLPTFGLKPAVADSVVALRRHRPIYDVREVPGIDSTVAARLELFTTTRGPGLINVNAASSALLRLLPGMTEEAVVLLVSKRQLQPIMNADELAELLSRSSRSTLLKNHAEFVRLAVFSPPQLIVTIAGGVRRTPIVARATLTVVPVPGRLTVIRRESE